MFLFVFSNPFPFRFLRLSTHPIDIQQTSVYEPGIIGQTVDLLMCLGDGKTDESVFALLGNLEQCIACTIGKKTTKAHYYLDTVDEVKKMLKFLTDKEAPAEIAQKDDTV